MDYQKKYEIVMDMLQGLIANAKKNGHIIVRVEDIENAIPELQQGEKKHKFIIGDVISNNNAIYRVDNIVKNCIGQDCYFLVNVESEKDGTRYLRLIDSDGKTHNSGEITWLCEQVDAKFKKQVEQKPTDKVEPKFKDGDWIIDIQDGEILHINKVRDYSYYVTNLEGASFDTPRFSIEKYNRLWTIQDAKDGDVLATDKGGVFIYAKVLYNKPYAYCGVDKFGVFKDSCLEHDWSNSVDNIHPATKEQRDLFFSKMKEAGYEWNAEKKFISSTKPNDENTASIWGDVDEYMLNETIQHLEILIRMEKNGVDCYSQYYQRDIDWLKSLKERLQPQWKPSEEQLNALDEIYKTHSANSVCRRIIFNLLEQLKKL